MKFIRSFIGYMIAGVLVMAVWGQLTEAGGIFGGYLAATILVGPLWFMNHYINLVDNKNDAAFVDMGLAIGICGIFRDMFLTGTQSFVDSLPTILLVSLGAVVGGLVAAAIEKDMAKEVHEHVPEPGMTEEEMEKLDVQGGVEI